MLVAIITGAFIVLILVRIIFNVSTNDNENDIRNWVSLTIESGIGIFIAMMVLYYDRIQEKKAKEHQDIIDQLLLDVKKQQDGISELITKVDAIESTRRKSEYQHYKERLTFEMQIFLHRIDAVRTTLEQIDNLKLNISHAKTNLTSLRTINSIFDIPPEIRGELDDILSDYESLIESLEHGCMGLTGISGSIIESAQRVKKFFAEVFFQEDNNEKIDKNLENINHVLTRIIYS
jgi:hypothetical protein